MSSKRSLSFASVDEEGEAGDGTFTEFGAVETESEGGGFFSWFLGGKSETKSQSLPPAQIEVVSPRSRGTARSSSQAKSNSAFAHAPNPTHGSGAAVGGSTKKKSERSTSDGRRESGKSSDREQRASRVRAAGSQRFTAASRTPPQRSDDARGDSGSEGSAQGTPPRLTSTSSRVMSPVALSKEYWMPNEHCPTCYECHVSFSVFVRRHHCRVCGQIFCWRCCDHWVVLETGDAANSSEAPVRACNYCYKRLTDGGVTAGMRRQSTSFVTMEQEQVSESEEEEGSPVSESMFSAFEPRSSLDADDTDTPSSLVSGDEEASDGKESTPLRGKHRSQNPLDRLSSGELLLQTFQRAPTSKARLGARSTNDSGAGTGRQSASTSSAGSSKRSSQRLLSTAMSAAEGRQAVIGRRARGKRGGLPTWSSRVDLDEGECDLTSLRDARIVGKRSSTALPVAMGSRQLLHRRDSPSGLARDESPPTSADKAKTKGRHRELRHRSSLFNILDYPRTLRRTSHALTSSDVQGLTQLIQDRKEVKDGSSPNVSAPSSPERPEEATWTTSEQVELEARQLVRGLVKQQLKREGLAIDAWEPVVSRLIRQTIETIHAPVTDLELSMSILEYVRVKCIPSGTPQQSTCFSGLAIAKDVAHKSMKNSFSRPRLLLLGCPLEFHREKSQFALFDSLQQQELAYMRSLVNKIAELGPDLLLVEGSVCRVALDLLLKLRISVVLNVKPHIMDRIAYLTNSYALPSTTELLSLPPTSAAMLEGTCRFSSVHTQTFKKGGRHTRDPDQRTLMFFKGDTHNYHMQATILVRSDRTEDLKRVKRVLQLINTQYGITAAYHLKLETAYLTAQWALDRRLCPKPTGDVGRVEETAEEIVIDTVEKRASGPPSFLTVFQSPVHVHGDDYEVQESGDEKPPSPPIERVERPTSGQLDSSSAAMSSMNTAQDSADEVALLSFSIGVSFPSLSDLPIEYVSQWPVMAVEKKYLTPNFSTGIGSTSAMTNVERFDYSSLFKFRSNPTSAVIADDSPFAVYQHQHLNYVHSLCCRTSARQCIPYEVHQVEYYSENDMTFGDFLQDFCFTSQQCTVRNCHQTMVDHERAFLHGNGRINITVEMCASELCDRLALQLEEAEGRTGAPVVEQVFVWSLCRRCGKSSPFEVLSTLAQAMSFGKWLEHSFYCKDLPIPTASCPHSVTRDHIRYMYKQPKLVGIVYEKVKVRTARVPPLHVAPTPQDKLRELHEAEVKRLRDVGHAVYDTILAKINEVERHVRRAEDIESLADLKYSRDEERELFFQRLKREGANMENVFALNQLKQMLLINARTWNSTLSELLQNSASKSVTRRTALASSSTPGFSANSHGPIGGTLSPSLEIIAEIASPAPTPTANTTTCKVLRLSGPQEVDGVSPITVHAYSVADVKRAPQRSPFVLPTLPSSPERLMPSPTHVAPDIPKITRAARSMSDLRQEPHFEKVMRGSQSTSTSPAESPDTSPQRGRSSLTAPLDEASLQVLDRIGTEESIELGEADELSKTTGASDDADQDCTDGGVAIATDGVEGQECGTKEENLDSGDSSCDTTATGQAAEDGAAAQVPFDVSAMGEGNDEGDEEDEETEADLQGMRWKRVVRAGDARPANRAITQRNILGGRGRFCAETDMLHAFVAHAFVEGDTFSHKGMPVSNPLSETELSCAPSEGAIVRGQRMPFLGRTPPRTSQEDEEVCILDALREILPNLAAHEHPRDLSLGMLRDASGLFMAPGMGDTVIVLNENEPCSIIAYALRSVEYDEALKEKYRAMMPTVAEQHLKDPYHEIQHRLLLVDDPSDVEIKVEKDAQSRIHFSCNAHYAVQFRELRDLCGLSEEAFVQSLSRSKNWIASGGKSAATWEKTFDERFVVKKIPPIEIESFLEFAPLYFEYLAKAHYYKMPTALAKIFGAFSISYSRGKDKTIKQDVVVVENLFFNRTVSRIFDLKGSVLSRYVQNPTANQVLMDENLIQELYESPICINERSKAELTIAVWNDTLFLSDLNIMDYSLITGIDNNSNEVVIGIIDYMRKYTWDKQLETWVKSARYIAINERGKTPTVVSPLQYKRRFRDAIWNYFVMLFSKKSQLIGITEDVDGEEREGHGDESI